MRVPDDIRSFRVSQPLIRPVGADRKPMFNLSLPGWREAVEASEAVIQGGSEARLERVTRWIPLPCPEPNLIWEKQTKWRGGVSLCGNGKVEGQWFRC